jgi:hypothetical protein
MTTDAQPTIAQTAITEGVELLRRYFEEFGTDALSQAADYYRLSLTLRAQGNDADADRAVNAIALLIDTGRIKLRKDSIAHAKALALDLLGAALNKVTP